MNIEILRELYSCVHPGYHMNKVIIPFNYTIKVKCKSIQGRFAY